MGVEEKRVDDTSRHEEKATRAGGVDRDKHSCCCFFCLYSPLSQAFPWQEQRNSRGSTNPFYTTHTHILIEGGAGGAAGIRSSGGTRVEEGQSGLGSAEGTALGIADQQQQQQQQHPGEGGFKG